MRRSGFLTQPAASTSLTVRRIRLPSHHRTDHSSAYPDANLNPHRKWRLPTRSTGVKSAFRKQRSRCLTRRLHSPRRTPGRARPTLIDTRPHWRRLSLWGAADYPRLQLPAPKQPRTAQAIGPSERPCLSQELRTATRDPEKNHARLSSSIGRAPKRSHFEGPGGKTCGGPEESGQCMPKRSEEEIFGRKR